jgi:hypothetical protein
MPGRSLAKAAYLEAVREEGTFHERVQRAHVAVHGRVPTQAEWGAPGAAGKADTKQARAEGVVRTTRELWPDTMAGQRTVADGTRVTGQAETAAFLCRLRRAVGAAGAWCAAGTPPWSTEGLLWQVRHGQYSGAGMQ